MVRSLYRFHAYYHIRRILKKMQTPLPSGDRFDKYNNAFSLEQVRKIGDEYGCSTKSLGIYKNEYYFDRSGVGSQTTHTHNNWSRWIMNSSHGFTKYGIEKISEPVRAYSYLILTSQASARHGILGDTAPALAAQRIFYDNFNLQLFQKIPTSLKIGSKTNLKLPLEFSADLQVKQQLHCKGSSDQSSLVF